MFCLIRIRSDYEIQQRDVIECSEDRQKLQTLCDEYNEQQRKYILLQFSVQEWEKKISEEWKEASKFVKLEKVPNRKPDGSNNEEWEAIRKQNFEKLRAEKKIFREEYSHLKVPEELKIFFDSEFDLSNLYCTRFEVVETKNHPWRK